MIDWIGKMCHIYTMEYYAAIKNDEFCGTYTPWNIMQQSEMMSSCRLQGHDKAGNDHSQQTDTRTENQTACSHS